MKTQTLTLLPALKWLALALLTLPTPAPAQWTNDPWNGQVTLTLQAGTDVEPQIVRLSTGKYLVIWQHLFPDNTKYQVLASTGIPLSGSEGQYLFGTNWGYGFERFLIPDGQGGAICVVSDARNGTKDVYGQCFDSLGNRLWGDTGLPLVLWPGSEDISLKDVSCDSLGGFFISWVCSAGPGNPDIYMQKFNIYGNRIWGNYGMPVCTAAGQQDYQQSVPDNQGGIIDVWADDRATPNDYYLYAQRLDANGNPLWAVNGISLLDPQTLEPLYVNGIGGGVPDGSGGGVWSYDTYWTWRLFRLTGTGQMLWRYAYNMSGNCTVGAPLHHPADGSIWLTTEEDHTGTGMGSYLYHFNLAGRLLSNLLINSPGITLTACQVPVQCPTNNGVIAISLWWQTPIQHLQATRVDSTGIQAWQSEVSLCHSFAGGQTAYCVSDDAEGAICAWYDYRNWYTTNADIFAQRVLSNGQLGNPPPNPHRPDIPAFSVDYTGSEVILTLPQATLVKMQLFDLLGRTVKTIGAGEYTAGTHRLNLDTENLCSGVYWLTVTAGGEEKAVKVVISH